MDITFLDTISLPWATRLAHAGAVAIMGVKEFMPMSIFPNSKKTPELMKLVNEVFPIRPEFYLILLWLLLKILILVPIQYYRF